MTQAYWRRSPGERSFELAQVPTPLASMLNARACRESEARRCEEQPLGSSETARAMGARRRCATAAVDAQHERRVDFCEQRQGITSWSADVAEHNRDHDVGCEAYCANRPAITCRCPTDRVDATRERRRRGRAKRQVADGQAVPEHGTLSSGRRGARATFGSLKPASSSKVRLTARASGPDSVCGAARWLDLR
jgi:hypothetical protein